MIVSSHYGEGRMGKQQRVNIKTTKMQIEPYFIITLLKQEERL